MLQKHKWKLMLSAIVILLPMFFGLYFWHRLPARLATTFSNGTVTGYSGKTFAVIGIPLLLLAVQLICFFVTAADPKRKNIHDKMLAIVLCTIPACSLLCGASMYGEALGWHVNIEKIMPLFIGILFVVLGIFLPGCRQNYTVGIKLPWTIADEENWEKTHRFAGPIWIAAGILAAVTGLLQQMYLFIAAILLAAVIPSVYSYCLYRKKQKEL